MHLAGSVCAALVVTHAAFTAAQEDTRPVFMVPSLIGIRGILAQLEAPIVGTFVQRFSLPVVPSEYTAEEGKFFKVLTSREAVANSLQRYAYGTLEYPFTLPQIPPDVTTNLRTFPPGQFKQDNFTGNKNLTDFYITTLLPLLSMNHVTTPPTSVPQSFFFHFSNTSTDSFPDAEDRDATFNLDVTFLQLISNRVHIGKSVAEAKFQGAPGLLTPLIQAQNATSIRTLLTNRTQEAQVFAQADAAALALSGAWITAGESVSTNFTTLVRNATAVLFRQLIDLTTEIEVQYLLERFS